eukprot:3236808-Prorocentrum_lima.AAC.1
MTGAGNIQAGVPTPVGIERKKESYAMYGYQRGLPERQRKDPQAYGHTEHKDQAAKGPTPKTPRETRGRRARA